MLGSHILFAWKQTEYKVCLSKYMWQTCDKHVTNMWQTWSHSIWTESYLEVIIALHYEGQKWNQSCSPCWQTPPVRDCAWPRRGAVCWQDKQARRGCWTGPTSLGGIVWRRTARTVEVTSHPKTVYLLQKGACPWRMSKQQILLMPLLYLGHLLLMLSIWLNHMLLIPFPYTVMLSSFSSSRASVALFPGNKLRSGDQERRVPIWWRISGLLATYRSYSHSVFVFKRGYGRGLPMHQVAHTPSEQHPNNETLPATLCTALCYQRSSQRAFKWCNSTLFLYVFVDVV